MASAIPGGGSLVRRDSSRLIRILAGIESDMVDVVVENGRRAKIIVEGFIHVYCCRSGELWMICLYVIEIWIVCDHPLT